MKKSVDKHLAQIREFNERSAPEVVLDLGDLWYGDEGRSDAADWFTAHGWTTTVVDSHDESDRLGRPVVLDPNDDSPFAASFVVAAKS